MPTTEHPARKWTMSNFNEAPEWFADLVSSLVKSNKLAAKFTEHGVAWYRSATEDQFNAALESAWSAIRRTLAAPVAEEDRLTLAEEFSIDIVPEGVAVVETYGPGSVPPDTGAATSSAPGS